MICGKRGDRGVCPLCADHTGDCETVHGKPLTLTEVERGWHRFMQVTSDWLFVTEWILKHDYEMKKRHA